jgi:dihydrolipoyl dehydrogenase
MYDVIVIGGGPGGYASAIRAAQLGGRVALVEVGDIGGTCVNRGCIPTKVWQHSAQLLHNIRLANQFGINATIEKPDLKTLVDRKNGVAADIRMGMEGLLANNGVEVVKGHADIKNTQEIDVDGTVLETRKMIIASGSRLDIPDIAGLDKALLTTDQFMDLDRIPASVLVLASDPMAVEIANTLNSFGSKVYMATKDSRIFAHEDHDTSQRVTQSLREQGIEVFLKTGIEALRPSQNEFEAVLVGPKEQVLEVEKVLVSSRKPNTASMGLDQVGIQLNDNGSIAVNNKLETSVPGIYAIGDATGGWMLSHAASSMAVTAAENAMGNARAFAHHLIPRGIWTIPQVGSVGLSEEEAETKGLDIEVGSFPYAINGMAMASNEMTGAVKIVSESRYGEILGVHIVGANATDMVAEAVLAIQLEATVRELAQSIRIHPTFSESLVEAGRDCLDWALYLPKR